jgi:[ribosomal protein S5]-alanine N-acetyltransferase
VADPAAAPRSPGLPERIATERLRLVLVTRQDAADMLAGRHQDRWHPSYPRRDDVDAASLVGEEPDPWGPRHVVWGHHAVGTIGCFGPPRDGETEVGFGLVAEARGRGVATEALRALVGEVDRTGVALRATVDPDNAASLRVLATCGFTRLRGSTDDGRLVIARPVVGRG